MIKFKQKGDFSNTKKLFNKLLGISNLDYLNKYGERGVKALSSATPVDTGRTADSWYYEIVKDEDSVSIIWSNSNVNKGVPIAIILQYGHATENGGFVKGIDYINPSIRPIFEKISKDLGKELRDA